MPLLRKSILFLAIVGIEVGLLAGFALYARFSGIGAAPPELRGRRELVEQLTLTDPALWTEARYTRHPSQTDFASPFQDFPASLDHFPAGSILAPAAGLPGGRR